MIDQNNKKFREHRRRVDSQKRSLGKVHKSKLFSNFELTYRAGMKARKIRISALAQKIFVGGAAILVSAVLSVSAFSLYQLSVADERYQNFYEARLVLEEMYRELETLRSNFELAERSVSNADKLRAVNDWIRGGRLDSVDRKLDKGLILEGESKDKFAILATRKDFLTQIKNLKERLAEEESEKQALLQVNEQASSRLKRSEKNYEGALEESVAFQRAVATSQQRALEAEKNNRLAEDALSETVESLRRLTGLANQGNAASPVDQINIIAGRLVELHKDQSALVERYVISIDYLTQNIYHIVRKAGLDVDELVKLGYLTPYVGGIGEGGIGEGGIAENDLISSERLRIDHQNLKNRLNSLEVAQKLMRCIPLSIPVENHYISSSFGERRNPYNRTEFENHNGLDFGSWYGKPVWVTTDGVVKFSGRRGGFGNLVIVDNGCGFSTYYAHLSKTLVKKGNTLKIGDVIGLVGSSGRSSGPHLHYEIRFANKAYDPLKFLEAGRYVYK